jgi:hypothetical protein
LTPSPSFPIFNAHMRRTLFTGGCGFVSSHAPAGLEAAGCEPVPIDDSRSCFGRCARSSESIFDGDTRVTAAFSANQVPLSDGSISGGTFLTMYRILTAAAAVAFPFPMTHA